jgi:signal transduction histidine kinase
LALPMEESRMNTCSNPRKYRVTRLLSRWAPDLTVGILVVVVVGLVVSTRHFESQTIAIYKQRSALTKNIERIGFYDEALTSSARLAAASGNPRYERRYERLAPQLDRLIKNTVALVGTGEAVAKIAQTDAANRALVAMEQRSFRLDREGLLAEATALLTGPDYLRQKQIYATGARQAFATFLTSNDMRIQGIDRDRMLALVLGAVSVLALLGFGLFNLRRGREHARLAVENGQHFEAAQSAREELAAQNEQLLSLDRMKDELVATASHELRTPLTSILGYLDLVLEDDALTAEQRTYLDVVHSNARRLQALASDLVFVAQAQAGPVALEHDVVALADVIEQAIVAAQPAADSRGVNLTLHSGDEADVFGDARRLGQLVDNLLSNAVKFTPAGGSVAVRLLTGGERYVIEVADTGMGMTPADQEGLFTRFYRTETARRSAVRGTGLGLSIVKAIVDGHGGEITVESAENEGTTFRVFLPKTPIQAHGPLVHAA